MTSAFSPMSQTEQRAFRGAYLRYLEARDGLPDLATQRFSRRELLFAALDAAPCAWVGAPPVDQERFDRNHARRRPEPNLDAATLWALATAKTNRAERFGVEYSVKHGAPPRDATQDPITYIQIEEFYHTRILKDALAAIGLRVEVGEPSPVVQAMVKAMVHLPKGLADVVVLCGEVTGVVLFSLLLDEARRLFAHQPAALKRIEGLFGQILVDEVGHVHYVRSGLGPAQLTVARRLLPAVAKGVLRDNPELELLLGRDRFLEAVRLADVDGAASAYADRFVMPVA
jgi:hypothetical protein